MSEKVDEVFYDAQGPEEDVFYDAEDSKSSYGSGTLSTYVLPIAWVFYTVYFIYIIPTLLALKSPFNGVYANTVNWFPFILCGTDLVVVSLIRRQNRTISLACATITLLGVLFRLNPHCTRDHAMVTTVSACAVLGSVILAFLDPYPPLPLLSPVAVIVHFLVSQYLKGMGKPSTWSKWL